MTVNIILLKRFLQFFQTLMIIHSLHFEFLRVLGVIQPACWLRDRWISLYLYSYLFSLRFIPFSCSVLLLLRRLLRLIQFDFSLLLRTDFSSFRLLVVCFCLSLLFSSVLFFGYLRHPCVLSLTLCLCMSPKRLYSCVYLVPGALSDLR